MAALSPGFAWRNAPGNVHSDTLLRWHLQAFRLFWRWKSKTAGRPRPPKNLQALIGEVAARGGGRQSQLCGAQKYDGRGQRGPGRPRTAGELELLVVPIAGANQDWGDRRIQGALSNLGNEIARSTIAEIAVTAHPTSEWTAQQIRETFPWNIAPRNLRLDRDRIFGKDFADQVEAMGINQMLPAPRSPWQRACVERVIGSIRRECLDHVIVFGDRSLSRHLQSFVDYHHRSRTHVGSEKDSPVPRAVQSADRGRVIAMAEVGGLPHRYKRRAAYRHLRRVSIRNGLCP